jgi:hypothetical protein
MLKVKQALVSNTALIQKKESNTANRQIFQSKKNVMVNVLKKYYLMANRRISLIKVLVSERINGTTNK